MTIDEAMSELSVIKLIITERSARDRGDWPTMRATYASDSVVHLSWYRGDGQRFVDESARMSQERSWRAHHFLAPALVTLNARGDRAFAEVGVVISMRQRLELVDVDVTSYGRLLYRARRTPAGWSIVHLTMVYDRDTLVPVTPGATPHLNSADLARYRPSYRYLSYLAERSGGHPRTDLPGADRPELVTAVYESANGWLDAEDTD